MVTMATLTVTLFIAALCVSVSSTLNVKHLLLTWRMTSTGFFEIPGTKEALLALDENYIHMADDPELNASLYSYCKDPQVAIMFDSYGNLAGIRTGYVINKLNVIAKKNNLTFPYRFDDKPLYGKSKYWGVDVYHLSVLFLPPAMLIAGGRPNITDKSMVDSVWIKLYGNWTQLPEDQCKAFSVGYSEQGCIPTMGKHYFYNTGQDCSVVQGGLFLLYENGQLMGLGLTTFGFHAHGKRKWLESPSSTGLRLIIPNNRPKCLAEWTDKYGLTVLHIFFKEHPRRTLCPKEPHKC